MEIAAIIFILLLLAVAYIAFRILKRTVKIAVRAIIFLLIVVIAVVGGLALWNLDSFKTDKKPAATKKNR